MQGGRPQETHAADGEQRGRRLAAVKAASSGESGEWRRGQRGRRAAVRTATMDSGDGSGNGAESLLLAEPGGVPVRIAYQGVPARKNIPGGGTSWVHGAESLPLGERAGCTRAGKFPWGN